MIDELNQLIRLAQVLRVRAENLADTMTKMKPPKTMQAAKAVAAASAAREAQTKLEQVRAYFD